MKIYLVGGAVRDKLLNFPYTEKDWVVVGGSPDQLLALGYQAVGKDFPVFLHPDSKEEYALARTERKVGQGYTGFECYSSPEVTLEEDLKRRDLTINAIAEGDQGQLIDPYHGRADLDNKLLRHVSSAFSEDPLRVLRVARFAARYQHLGFKVAEETLLLMQAITRSGELKTLPAERIWKEMQRALTEKNPEAFFLTLQHCDALAQLLPDINQAAIENLRTARQQSSNSRIVFSCMLAALDAEQCRGLCTVIRVPGSYRELACLLNQYGSNTNKDSLSAEQQLVILESVDAFRRPERFDDFLQGCKILFHNNATVRQLNAALVSAKSIDIKPLAAQFSGKKIAEAIRQHRVAAIAKLENQ